MQCWICGESTAEYKKKGDVVYVTDDGRHNGDVVHVPDANESTILVRDCIWCNSCQDGPLATIAEQEQIDKERANDGMD